MFQQQRFLSVLALENLLLLDVHQVVNGEFGNGDQMWPDL